VFGSSLRYIMLVSTLLYITKQFLCGSHKSVYHPSYEWDKLYIPSVHHYLLLLPNKGCWVIDTIYDFIPSILKKFIRNVVCCRSLV